MKLQKELGPCETILHVNHFIFIMLQIYITIKLSLKVLYVQSALLLILEAKLSLLLSAIQCTNHDPATHRGKTSGKLRSKDIIAFTFSQFASPTNTVCNAQILKYSM